ncbi:MAG: glycosyltransferase family 2 protein [Acidobacteriales bacterium]|nr:glycosyltransferase family 2 protein [Terriglobales bacterium]
MDSLNYSIIIPAYNESERLPASLDKILAYVAQQAWSAEVIVVNDGSRDSTADVVRQYARSHPIVRLVENPGNRGKGYAVRNGMSQAKGDILLFSDADLSSPIYEAGKLLRALAQGADIAIGSRWLNADLQTQRQPFYRQLSGRVFNLLLRLVLGLKQKDTQCGFKAFTRRAGQAIFPLQRIERWGFDPEILYIANKFGFKTVEVPVEWANDERSKINPLRDGTRMFLELCKIRWNAIRGRYAVAKIPPPASRVAGSQLPVAGSEAGSRKH